MSAEWNMKSLLTQASVLITHYSLLRTLKSMQVSVWRAGSPGSA